jgi:hypothetical protein
MFFWYPDTFFTCPTAIPAQPGLPLGKTASHKRHNPGQAGKKPSPRLHPHTFKARQATPPATHPAFWPGFPKMPGPKRIPLWRGGRRPGEVKTRNRTALLPETARTHYLSVPTPRRRIRTRFLGIRSRFFGVSGPLATVRCPENRVCRRKNKIPVCIFKTDLLHLSQSIRAI